MVNIMRIDAYNAVNQIYQTATQTQKINKEKKIAKDDKFEISQTGKDLAVAKKAISDVPDIREEKVETIKKQMKEGTYRVSTEDVAEKILSSMTGSIF